jgi:hypothetical protein
MERLPFPGPDRKDLKQQHLNDDPPLMPGVSTLLSAIIMRCLYKFEDQRPLPDVLLKELHKLAAIEGESTHAGVNALRFLNLDEIKRRDRSARKAQQEREKADRRAELLKFAIKQAEQISQNLKQTIVENLSYSKSVATQDSGWQITFNNAHIRFSTISEQRSQDGASIDILAWCLSRYAKIKVRLPVAEERTLYGFVTQRSRAAIPGMR